MNRFLYLACALVIFGLFADKASGEEGAGGETQTVDVVGYGSDHGKAVEAALAEAVRQVMGARIAWERETGGSQSGITGEDGVTKFSSAEITNENVESRSRGQVVRYEMLEFRREEDENSFARLRVTVRTREGLAKIFVGHVEKGDQLYRENQFAAAAKVYEEAMKFAGIEDRPKVVPRLEAAKRADRYVAFMNDGKAKYNIHDYAGAKESFGQALLIFPDAKDPKEYLERIRAIEDGPLRYRALMDDGNRFLREGRHADALARFQQAQDVPGITGAEKTNAEIGMGRAQTAINEGNDRRRQTDELNRQYEQLVREGKAHIETGKKKFNNEFRRREYNDAKQKLAQALQIRPNDPVAALAYQEAERLIAAIPPPPPPCKLHLICLDSNCRGRR